MARPLVSVFVPSFNHAQYIATTLKSILEQTYRPIELLVIDDGSKDDSAEVIARCLERAPFPAKFIHRENRGLTATLNEGLAWASGDYFAYLGSDDLWMPKRIERGVTALERNSRAVMAFSHCQFIDAAGRVTDVSSRGHAPRSGYYFWPMMSGIVGIMSPTPLFRRSVLAPIGWNEHARLEDFELYLSLSLQGPFEFIDEVLGAWRHHAGNASKNWQLMTTERIAIIERAAERLALPEELVARLRQRILFEEAGALLQGGQRLKAALETMRHWRGARSPAELAKRAAWLLAPDGIAERRRNWVAQHLGDE